MGRLQFFFFFFQAEDGIRDWSVTGVQTCALPIFKAVSFASVSLIERDYVMRLVKQIVDFIARALNLAKQGKDKEAIELLESGCLSALGIPWSALALVDSKSAAGVLGDAPRIAAFARILEERANIE